MRNVIRAGLAIPILLSLLARPAMSATFGIVNGDQLYETCTGNESLQMHCIGSDRCCTGDGPIRYHYPCSKRLCAWFVLDQRPVNDLILAIFAGPLDERHGDTAVVPRAHRLDDLRVLYCMGAAVDLQRHSVIADATRRVNRQHERKIDRHCRSAQWRRRAEQQTR